MCGIFAYLNNECIDNWVSECHERANKLKPRGPEKYKYILPTPNVFMGFQRLSIVDVMNGDQPFIDSSNSVVVICNGEIYNSTFLTKEYKLNVKSKSDCEVILHMYLKFGIRKTIESLDGDFAFIIYDKNRNEIICGRDPFGVRPLFLSIGKSIVISSELKALYGLKNVKVFPIGSYWSSLSDNYTVYNYNGVPANGSSVPFCSMPFDVIKETIKNKLEASVQKRLQSDRKIGCLLSGGLDSSLITALVHKHSNIVTYSVGLEGSVDLEYARKVASFLGTEHHEIIFTEEIGLQAISNVIYAIESWDTTTVRASVPMWLMCKYISENTPEVKVIMSGEGADEVCQGYLYFHNQPNPEEGHKESVRLLQDLLYFDVLRSDRSISTHGLEVRVPFLDKDFVHFYLSIPPEYRCPNKCEKWLLRESFKDNVLPDEILWRKKDGLSDGCSSFSRPWYQVIQEKAEKEVTDEELEKAGEKYSHCTPRTKESLLFRNIFNKHFPDRDTLIPYEWLPKWSGDMINPSGRLL